jgi:hypothetical protein
MSRCCSYLLLLRRLSFCLIEYANEVVFFHFIYHKALNTAELLDWVNLFFYSRTSLFLSHELATPKIGNTSHMCTSILKKSPGLDTMPDAKGRASTRISSQTFTIPVARRSFHSVALVALVAFSLPRACRLDGRAPPPPAGQGLGGLEGIEARERKEASPIDWQGLVGDNLVDDLSTPEWLSRMVMHMPA